MTATIPTPTATATRRRAARAAAAVAGALALVGAAGSGAASAAPAPIPAGHDYRDWAIGVPPDTYTVSDCRVSVGPVRDPWAAYPSYRKIAGVQIACSTRKPVIEATVHLQKWEGGRWVQKGNAGYGVLFNSFGSAGWKKGSQGICGGAGSYWRTYARVRIGASAWRAVASRHAYDPAGC